jgi:hypothetical protein
MASSQAASLAREVPKLEISKVKVRILVFLITASAFSA